VDRFDADGTRVFAPESTNPPTPANPKKHFHRSGMAEMPMASAFHAQEPQHAQ
jgi:hypothetical protein